MVSIGVRSIWFLDKRKMGRPDYRRYVTDGIERRIGWYVRQQVVRVLVRVASRRHLPS
jgi:hypothetical protein